MYKQIVIINDLLLENNETFSHRIQSDDPAAILNPDTAMVTIIDDDEGSICLSVQQLSSQYLEGTVTTI